MRYAALDARVPVPVRVDATWSGGVEEREQHSPFGQRYVPLEPKPPPAFRIEGWVCSDLVYLAIAERNSDIAD
jgi:hypothetical protein